MQNESESGAALYAEAIETLRQLVDEAARSGDPEPGAMNLATLSAGGTISRRLVLLKGLDQDGLQFFTNYQSDKGRQLADNPRAALVFLWLELENLRQLVLV